GGTPGAVAGTQAKSNREGRMTMQQGTSARRIGRNHNPVSGRRHTIAFVAAALLIALPFSANGQTGQGTTPAVSPAPSSAPATRAGPSALSQPAQIPAGGVPGGSPSAAAPAAPAASAPATSASAALPGEHMISGADLPEDLSPWGMF